MNVQSKTLIAAVSLVVAGIMPGLSMANSAEEIRARVGKVGKLNVGDGQPTAVPAPETAAPAATAPAAAPAPAAGGTVDPAALYQTSCFACHGTGAAGSPIMGDTAAWAPRIAQGEATLIEHALNGFNAMPPRGASTFSDDEIKAIVTYMIENSQ